MRNCSMQGAVPEINIPDDSTLTHFTIAHNSLEGCLPNYLLGLDIAQEVSLVYL